MADIMHFLLIRTTPDKIYKAITEQTGIAGLWTTDNTAAADIDIIIEFNFSEKDQNRMKVTDLVKNKKVEWICLEGDKEWVGTRYLFDLIEYEKG